MGLSSEEATVAGTGKEEVRKTSLVVQEEIKYPDVAYAHKNKQLHVLMKSIPSTDFVFDSECRRFLPHTVSHV